MVTLAQELPVKHVTEGTGRGGRRCKQLLEDLKKNRKY